MQTLKILNLKFRCSKNNTYDLDVPRSISIVEDDDEGFEI